MKLFLFTFKKALKSALIITLAVTLLSAVLLIYTARGEYAFSKSYTEAFEALDKDYAYTQVSKKVAEYEKARSDLANRVNDYIAKNSSFGKPPPTLPEGLAAAVIRNLQKGENSDSSDSEMYSFMLSNLKDSAESSELIDDKLSAFSRNARRGVTDEYSLALSAVLTDDYDEVIKMQERDGRLYDTRAANAFTAYIENDRLDLVLCFLLFFGTFSSELQSRRLSAFALTKAGAERFILSKLLSNILISLTAFGVYYLSLFLLMCALGGGECLSMPLQYLKGYELSSFDMSFGGFCLSVFLLRVLSVLLVSAVIMLLSFLCKRNIISGLVCLLPTGLIIGLQTYDSKLAKAICCKPSYLLGGEGYIDIFGVPFPVTLLYVLISSAAVFIVLITVYAQSLRREFS